MDILPKQLCWLSWEFILAVKSIVTDWVHKNITKSYLMPVLVRLVSQEEKKSKGQMMLVLQAISPQPLLSGVPGIS